MVSFHFRNSDIFSRLLLNVDDIGNRCGIDVHTDPLFVRIFSVEKLVNPLQSSYRI